ncbi:MAG: GNAT family N-acetyltransferase [Alphaproteobacteria bacterium]|nr:MAG: GNAT family N-acetyltransferase [Alphaproteobacteria bacterium]
MQNLALLNQIVKTKKTMSSIIRKKRIIKKIKSEFESIIFKNFTIKIAESNFEIKKAQSLRYKIFFKEKKIKKKSFKFLLQRDYDFYDKISDHLIIIDNNREIRDNVIGTYRLLRGNCAKLYRGFYTEQEFDISNLKKNFSSKDILELGRSCVHPQYRSGIILKLLWQGISNYIKMYKIKILMGCASFHGTNPSKFKDEFSLLYESYRLPEDYDVKSLQSNEISFNKNINHSTTLNKLPPLIKGYLRAGGMVSENFYIDTEFETIDYCVIMLTEKIVSRYQNKFLN